MSSNLRLFFFLHLSCLSIASVVAICMSMMATVMSIHNASTGRIARVCRLEIDPCCSGSSRGMLPVPHQGSTGGGRGEAVGGRYGERTTPSGSAGRSNAADTGCAAGTSGMHAACEGGVQGEDYWKSIGLEIRLHKQVTHTQRYMNNAWSEMVSSHPCLALYSSWSPWLVQTIWDNSSPTTDQPCRLITTLLLLVLHFYDYEQPNAPPPTKTGPPGRFQTEMADRPQLPTPSSTHDVYWNSMCANMNTNRL